MTELGQTTPEQTKKAEIINDRLNALSLESRTNLNIMLAINSIMLEAELIHEGKSEKEPKMHGWFDNVIDMLKTIEANNLNLKNELEKLRKEFKE